MQQTKFNSILHLEDNTTFREAIKNHYLSTITYNKLNSVEDFDSAKKCISENTYDLAILDIQLKNDNRTGFDLVNLLRLKNSSVKIIVLSMYIEEHYIEKFNGLKLNAYLSKQIDHSIFANCLNTILEGKIYLSPDVKEEYDNYIHKEQKRQNLIREVNLSKRELEIIQLLYEEKGNKEIADKLDTKEGTVKIQIHKLILKFKVKSRIGIVLLSIKNGLFSDKNRNQQLN